MPNMSEESWIPVGVASQFQPESCHPVVVDDYELVVWSGGNGEVRAWEDRCPHRGMRLSYGFVRDGNLTCLYHGWTYNSDGQCVRIPAHPDLDPPKTICTKSYPTRNCREIVYVNLANNPGSELSASEEGGWRSVRSIFVNVPVDTARQYFEGGDNVFGTAGKPDGSAGYKIDANPLGFLTLAIQRVGQDKSAIHASSTTTDAADLKELCRLLVRARRDLESR